MKFHIYTLGCKVNTYESNVMSDLLKNSGYEEVSTDEVANIVIINTCTVTNTADHKSMKVIRQAIKKNPQSIVIVCGCMAQNKKDEVENIDGVDIVIGNINKSKIVDYIEEYIQNKEKKVDIRNIESIEFEPMILNNFNKTRAFVKIQDGCNNFCSYCVIPYTRGNVRSKKREDVLREVNKLVEQGHKEIVLTGIHTGNYGVEFENYHFSNLLRDLIQIRGLERLRISSIEMNELTEDVLRIMKNSSILVDHLHIPMQSGSETVLKRMNRKYTKQEFINKIEQIRKIRPNISITTDIIVGFPGETEEEFLETVATVNQIRFSKLHVFPYSKRDKTIAATLPNQVNPSIKKERTRKLIELSKKLEIDYFEKFKNQEISFIPEVWKDGYLIGHTGNYLLVKILGEKKLLNTEIKIRINCVNYPYVIGNKVDDFIRTC